MCSVKDLVSKHFAETVLKLYGKLNKSRKFLIRWPEYQALSYTVNIIAKKITK